MLDALSKIRVRTGGSTPAMNDNVYPAELRSVGHADHTARASLLARSVERLSPWAVLLFLIGLVLVGLALPYL